MTKPQTNKAASSTELPFSENAAKPNHATRDELIADLRRLVEADPDRVLSRNYYRIHGSYAEAAWTGVFGTFAEFKKQANITASRHVKQIEKQVAKHAASESYKAMTREKQGWESKYLRPDAQRFHTHLIITDVHDQECDPFVSRVFLDTVARAQPTSVIIGGDLFDLPEFGKYGVDPREWNVVGRIKAAHDFIRGIRAAAPNTQIDLIEGNHEFRLLRHLAEASPAMRAVLADLHGFTVPKLLGLDEFEVNYHARGDLATFTQRDIRHEVSKNYMIVDNAFVVHHFPEGRDLGFPGVNGHHHKHIVWPGFSPVFGPFTWQQLGCAHRRQASYCAGEKWSLGFMLAHVDTHTRRTSFEYVDATHNHAVVGGKWFERLPSELVGE